MKRFLQTLQEAINQSLPDDKEIQDISTYYQPPSSNARPSTSHQPKLLTPKQLSKMGYPKQTNGTESLRDDSATSQDPPAMVDASTTLDDLETQLATALPTAPPLCYNWKNYAYTDGSYKQTNGKASPIDAECDAPGIGAGVYFPHKQRTRTMSVGFQLSLQATAIPRTPSTEQNWLVSLLHCGMEPT